MYIKKKYEALESENSTNKDKVKTILENEYASISNKLRDKVDTVVEKWKGNQNLNDNYLREILQYKNTIHELNSRLISDKSDITQKCEKDVNEQVSLYSLTFNSLKKKRKKSKILNGIPKNLTKKYQILFQRKTKISII